MSDAPRPRYTRREEIANALTHGLGALAALVGLIVLVVLAARHSDVWTIVGVSIFGSSLLLLYILSTLYHSLSWTRARDVLQRLDHVGIFLLIAGTYTPFLLVNLRGAWGWTLFGLVWGLALPCILVEAAMRRPPKSVMLAATLGLSWLAAVAVKPLLANVSPASLWLLLGGGLSYTLGVVFYVWKRLPWHHAIWHLFVIGGSALHFFSIYLGVLNR